MNSSELKLTLKKMIVEECDKDMEPGEIQDDEQLIGGRLDLDSLDALQISMWVQKQFGIRIENGPAARSALRSVDSLATLIQEELTARSAQTDLI
jgi:acyl carrier protein